MWAKKVLHMLKIDLKIDVCWTAHHHRVTPRRSLTHDERQALLGLHVSDSRLARCGGGEGGGKKGKGYMQDLGTQGHARPGA